MRVAHMTETDPELLRLQRIERLARDRFHRLSVVAGDADIIKIAEDLWTEAKKALLECQKKGRA